MDDHQKNKKTEDRLDSPFHPLQVENQVCSEDEEIEVDDPEDKEEKEMDKSENEVRSEIDKLVVDDKK